MITLGGVYAQGIKVELVLMGLAPNKRGSGEFPKLFHDVKTQQEGYKPERGSSP